MLVFSAHAADFCSRAGGTIMKFIEAGATVHVHDMSYGERCESTALWAQDPKPTIAEVKKIRAGEIERASSIVGATVDCFDWGDSPLLIDGERQLFVLQAIRAFRPEVILTHWKDDIMHPDHVEATRGVLFGCAYCGSGGIETDSAPCARPTVYMYETTSGTAPVSRFLPDTYVDISDVFERKQEALKELAAQPVLVGSYEVIGRYRAMEANHTAKISGCRYAEGFVRFGTARGQ
ncbi:MAG: PIG-L deacetylase family protein [Candidatus Latescibacterota bacterium]|nr:PIG-L deacetylase family protein [Candidatus Latescibacterota bacterium]